MTTLTRVSIYEVDATGMTGVLLGAGSLVDPRLVLVHAPLSDELAAGQGPGRLRLGMGSGGDGGGVEVMDVEEKPHVERGDGLGRALVVLQLPASAVSPTERVPGISDIDSPDKLVAAALEYLASVEEGDPRKPSPWCLLLGLGCG